MLRTVDQYKESLRDGREVYYRGEKVDDVTTHPILSLSVNHNLAMMSSIAEDKDLRSRMIVTHPEHGEMVRFFQAPKSTEDLLKRYEITSELTKRISFIVAHIGSDMLFALTVIANHVGKEYAERMNKFGEYIMKSDLAIAGAQMDVKGDRSLRPSQQADPDLYLHVVETRDDGIVVRGAKAHTSNAPTANELIVLPSRMMGPGEEDYAVAFAIPANTKGIKMICRPCTEAEGPVHQLEGPRVKKVAMVETTTIFDDVFVPWERVFVYRDPKAAGALANLFALFHRFSALSYRSALAEEMIGCAKLIAEYNGIDKMGHVMEKIATLINFAEYQKLCVKMSAYECNYDKNTGIAMPNILYANMGKLFSNQNYLNAIQALVDIAGGYAITAPSGQDYDNPELRKYIDKYTAGVASVPPGNRFKLFLFIREMVALLGGLETVTMIHAEGSVQASILSFYRDYNFEPVKSSIKELLGLE
jgi:4-hydroxybutyryl-CoA dehydratase/vinylacetyl-CoA-Delta-isomerase